MTSRSEIKAVMLRLYDPIVNSRFSEIDTILRETDYSSIKDAGVLMTYVRYTATSRKYLKEWEGALHRIEEIMVQRGDDVEGILIGLI